MLANILKPEAIIELGSCNRLDSFNELAEVLRNVYRLRLTAPQITSKLIEREQISSTTLDGGFAIPHLRDARVRKPCLAIGLSRRGVDMGATDHHPTRVLFLLAGPEDQPAAFLSSLSQITKTVRRLDPETLFRDLDPVALFRSIVAMA